MFGLGTPELVVIGVIVFVIFGAKRLPDIGKGLGGAIREFRQVKKDLAQDDTPSNSLESGIKDKVLDQVPGVKEAVDMKKKVDKVKDIMKS